MSLQPPGATVFGDPGLLARAIAEATDDVIFAKDLEGRYQFANPAMLAAVGCTAQEVLGRRDGEFLHDRETADRMMASDRRVLAEGRTMEVEESLRTRGGQLRHWHTRKMPLRDAQGALIGLLGR